MSQATYYIDSKTENVSEALLALGGAKIILCTAPNSKSMGDCIDGASFAAHGISVLD